MNIKQILWNEAVRSLAENQELLADPVSKNARLKLVDVFYRAMLDAYLEGVDVGIKIAGLEVESVA